MSKNKKSSKQQNNQKKSESNCLSWMLCCGSSENQYDEKKTSERHDDDDPKLSMQYINNSKGQKKNQKININQDDTIDEIQNDENKNYQNHPKINGYDQDSLNKLQPQNSKKIENKKVSMSEQDNQKINFSDLKEQRPKVQSEYSHDNSNIQNKKISEQDEDDYQDEEKDKYSNKDLQIKGTKTLNNQISLRDQKKKKFQTFLQTELKQGELFILGDYQNYILCRYSEKKIKGSASTDYTRQSIIGDSFIGSNKTAINFQKFELTQSIIPQKISQHIARKCKEYFVIDACCGIGGTLIQLSKLCDSCIGIDIDQELLKNAEQNLKYYQAPKNVELIQADFLTLKMNQSQIADVVFLNPSFVDNDYDLNKSQPNLLEAVKKSITFAKNIIVCVPSKVDIQQIAEIFNQSYKQQLIQDYKNYSIHIEHLQMKKQQSYYVVYYGDIAKITLQEQIEFLLTKFKQTSELACDKTLNLINYLVIKIGVKGILKYIQKAEQKMFYKQNSTILQIFTDLLEQEQILTKKEYQQNFMKINFQDNRSYSYEEVNAQYSPSFNSKLFKNSHDSNEFQLAVSSNNKQIQEEEEKRQSKVQNKNAQQGKEEQKEIQVSPNNSIPQNTFRSEQINIGSKLSDFNLSKSQEEDEDEEDEENFNSYDKNNYVLNVDQSDNNISQFKKAKSYDVDIFKRYQSSKSGNSNLEKNIFYNNQNEYQMSIEEDYLNSMDQNENQSRVMKKRLDQFYKGLQTNNNNNSSNLKNKVQQQQQQNVKEFQISPQYQNNKSDQNDDQDIQNEQNLKQINKEANQSNNDSDFYQPNQNNSQQQYYEQEENQNTFKSDNINFNSQQDNNFDNNSDEDEQLNDDYDFSQQQDQIQIQNNSSMFSNQN